MNYTFTKLPKSEIEIEVTIPFSELEPHLKDAARLISEEIDIEGFRKGKAPYETVKNRVGEAAIYERAADLAVRKTYPKIVEEVIAKDEALKENPPIGRPAAGKVRPIVPIGRPEITVTKLAPGNDFTYKARFAHLPRVTLPDYVSIARVSDGKKKEISVTDEEVRESIDWVRESRAKLVAVNRPAAKGDRVEIDFEIKHNGATLERGQSRNHPLILGTGRFLPGFEDAVIGMRAGETKDFSLVAPDDWHEKSLAGKKLDFHVKIKSVEERTVPELTDEFVKGLGKFESVGAFEQSVKEGLIKERKEKEKQRVRIEMIEAIAKDTEIDLPEVLVNSEFEKMIGELRSGLENMQMKWDDYLSHIGKTVEDLRKEWRADAQKRVRIALTLREIACREKIEPSSEEIEEAAGKYLVQFASSEEAKRFIDPERLREYAKGVLINEKVFEFLEKV